MNRPVVAVATVLVLLALTHYTDADAIFDYMKAHEEPFDPYPHPPFPQINCEEFKKKLDEMPGKICPDPIAPGPNAYSNNDIDKRVCVEYRFWYTSHCNMMADYCNRHNQHYNLIGMCHKSRRPGHHKSLPYRVCDKKEPPIEKAYCPSKKEEHLCSAFMFTYQSMCHMLRDHCINNVVKRDRELAKIVSPRTHKDLFHTQSGNYYDKCGMYNPLVHGKNSFFVNRFPNLEHVQKAPPSKEISKTDYEDHIRPTSFKYDHVCRNTGVDTFQMEHNYKVTGPMYKIKHLSDGLAQEKKNVTLPGGAAGPRNFTPETNCPGAKDEKTIETIMKALKDDKDFD